MKQYLLFYFLLFELVAFHSIGRENIPVILNDNLNQIGVRKSYLKVYEDKSNLWTIENVRSERWRDSFQILTQKYPTNRNKSSTYWLQFKIVNKASKENRWLLEFFDHTINELTLYSPKENNSFKEFKTGNSFPFLSRVFNHKNFEFDLDVGSGEEAVYFVKLRSKNDNVIIPEIRSYKRFVSYALQEYFMLGIFYGILAIMSVYNFLLYLSLKKNVYLYYVFYVFSVGLYTLSQNGLNFQFIWPTYPELNLFSLDISIYLTMLFSILFTKKFLNFKEKFPVLNTIINNLLFLRSFLLIPLLLLFPYENFKFLDLIPLSVTLYTVILYLKNGYATSGYFGFAFIMVFITFVVNILEQYGIIWSDIFTVYSMNIGIVTDIVLLSISLAHKMRYEINTKEAVQSQLVGELREKEVLSQKVNKELEEKVTERTIELNRANEHLKKQAELITQMNLRLDLANTDLKKNVTEISKNRIVKPLLTFSEFLEVYTDAAACYRLIDELKSSREFRCKKCRTTAWGKGKDVFDRRCTKCGYNESVTANTLFHKLKFPIVKAFYMTHVIFSKNKITGEDLSKLVLLRKETCSVFKRKVLERIELADKKELKSWDRIILNENLYVNEVED